MLGSDAVGQHVELSLRLLLLVDDDGVVEVAALDESGSQHHFHFTHETESTCGSDVVGELLQVGKLCGLVAEYFAREGYGGRDAKTVGRLYGERRARMFVLHLQLLADDEVFALSLLLHDAHAHDVLDVNLCRAVEDGHFGAVDLQQAVVYAQGIEGGHGMLYGAAARFAKGEHGAACRLYDIFSYGVDDGLTGEVYALDFISVVLGCGVERYREFETCVQAFALQGKAVA